MIEYLLYGPDEVPLEDRPQHLLSGTKPFAMTGFKESLLTRVLCVVQPERFLSILKYTTEAGGKMEIARAVYGLELPAPESVNWTLGRLECLSPTGGGVGIPGGTTLVWFRAGMPARGQHAALDCGLCRGRGEHPCGPPGNYEVMAECWTPRQSPTGAAAGSAIESVPRVASAIRIRPRPRPTPCATRSPGVPKNCGR